MATGRDRIRRRTVLAAIGGAAVSVSASLAGCGETIAEWTPAAVPTDATLYDVGTTATGAVAVGEDGIVLTRDDESWSVALPNGPGETADTLRSLAVTNNGRAVWAAGDSGALGLYDVVADQAVDFSAPKEMTSSWTAVAVAGLAGEERITALNGSGELLHGQRDGASVEWAEVIEPGTGSSVTDVDITPLSYVYTVDTDGGAFESRDGGDTWTRIGIDAAAVDFDAVAAVDSGAVSVAGGDGTVWNYNGVGWSRASLAETAITALVRNRYDALAIASSGDLFERDFDGWTTQTTLPAQNDPLAIALGTSRAPELVVGESGMVIERQY
ncbi:hypothetical protein [Natrialba sp. PRR66]|uniref:hypothetical protein n=1 Tax=Natrialba sp. PRR66 TaxID=3098146 RepID=UPI002B1E53E6|nr:hypothetical protein [Natrialba sp. PRR66]